MHRPPVFPEGDVVGVGGVLMALQSAANGLSFLPEQHLRRSEDFAALRNDGVRDGDDHLLLFAKRNQTGVTRIGFSVSRRHGSAVRRNRKRRLMREAFRLNQSQIPRGMDLLLVPRLRSDSGLAEFSQSLIRLSQRLEKRLARVPT